MSDREVEGPISEYLAASWAEWQNASLYGKWREDNPGEDDKLRYYWNHEGEVPQLATATGKAYVLEAQGYWEAVHTEAMLYHPPFECDDWIAKAIIAGPAVHGPHQGNGFAAAYDFEVEPGTPIYAVEAGSCKHVYPDGLPEDGGNVPGAQQFTMDGASGWRWFYGHVLRPDSDMEHRPAKGEQIGTCAGARFHFSGNNASELDRLVYST